LELVIGRKGNNAMKKKIKYTGELALKDRTIRVTLNLNEDSVTFFKEEARKEGIPYQRLIRKVIDLYAQHHQA
jgi:predicted DNA binding CopG/RHH family protein